MKNLKKRSKIISLLKINFILIGLFLTEILYLYNNELSYNLFFRKVLDFQFLFVLCFSLLCGTILICFFQPYNIFLGTFFLFLGSRFFLDLFNLRDVMLMDRFVKIYLEGFEQIKLYKIMIFAVLFINLGFLLGNLYYKNNNYSKEYSVSTLNLLLKKIYLIFFELFFSLEFYKKILLYKFVLKNDYLDLYKKEIVYPFFTKGSGTFFEINYILFLVTKPKKNEFIIVSVQYLFIGFLEALSGRRGRFITRILVVLTYYFCEYNKKINFILIGGVSSFIIFFSQYINQSRSGLPFKLGKAIFSFFDQQGTSINVIGTIIKFKEDLGEIIKFSIISLSSGGTNTISNAESGVLTYTLTYFLSPTRYLNGEGMGGSFLGEIIALDSYLAFIILNTLLGFLIYIIFIFRKKTPLNMGIYLIILPHIYYMSRDSYLPNIKYSPFYFLFIIIHYLIYKKLENKFEKRSFY